MTLSTVPLKGKQINSSDFEDFIGAWLKNFFVSGFTPSLVSNVVQVTTGVAMVNGVWVNEAAATFNIPFVASGAHVWLQLTFDGSGYVTGAQYVAQSSNPGNAIKICDYADNGTQVTSVTDQTTNSFPGITTKAGLGMVSWIEMMSPITPGTGQYTGYSYLNYTAGAVNTPTEVFGGLSATGAQYGVRASNQTISSDVASLRRLIEFSQIGNLRHAYFEAVLQSCATMSDVNHAVLYNVTDSAAISDITVSSSGSSAQNIIKSGDIKASLPTADKTLTLQMYDSGGHALNMAQARLKLYW